MRTRRSVSRVRADTLAEAQARAGATRGLRHRRHSGRHRARGAEGRRGAPAGLRRFRLFPALQPHAPGHPRGADAVRADLLSRERRPDGSLYRAALPRQLAGRGPEPAAVQSDRRLCAATSCRRRFMLILQQTLLMGVGDARRRRLRAGRPGRARRRGAAVAVLGQGLAHLLLALPGAALFLVVLPRALRHFRRPTRLGDLFALLHSVHPVGELPRPVRRHVVQAPRDRGAAVHRHQPAAVLPGRRLLAGRGDPRPAARRRASSSPARRRSMAWCASTRWARR